MGRLPPPTLGNSAMTTMPIISGHLPSISASTKMRSRAVMAATDIRLSARGCKLSHPSPVPLGKAAHACIAAVTHSSGRDSPNMAGHNGVGGCASACHTMAHAVASRSTSCWECKGISVLSMVRNSMPSAASAVEPSASCSARAAWSIADGTQPPATRDMRCCRLRPAAGPSCSQACQLRRRASKSEPAAALAL